MHTYLAVARPAPPSAMLYVLSNRLHLQKMVYRYYERVAALGDTRVGPADDNWVLGEVLRWC